MTIPLYVGFDDREAAAYHTFCHSVISHASHPVAFMPLALHTLRGYDESHSDGSNAFIYSRFLVPHLQGFKGWAIFADGDMICREDINELWMLRDNRYAVMVAKHDYKTKHKRKYLGSAMQTINQDYPRKNWSSVMLWNCEHPANRILTPAHVMASSGNDLHRFKHLHDDDIGDLPLEWNWLIGEYDHNKYAKLAHYTLGVPGILAYAECDHAREWFDNFYAVSHIDL
jgi:lipopolysaccharide biosynthesis glycosyltransferase